MKKYFVFVFLSLMLTTVFSCSINEITTDNLYYEINSTSEIIVSTTKECENYNINVFARDLMTLQDQEIYDGKINSSEMQFTITTTQPTVKKIYASVYQTKNKTLKEKSENTSSTPIITTIGVTRVNTYLREEIGTYNPYTYEYGETIDLNLYIRNNSNSGRNSDFGFYFLNNDFNVISITGDFDSCEKFITYPYGCKFNADFEPNQYYTMIVRISKLKYNDTIFTFGTDGLWEKHDVNKPIFAKPFITITNITKDLQNEQLILDYNIYNYDDINYCKLIIDGNEIQSDYNIQQNNQFIQDLNLGDYIIDINCFTDNNHYTYPTTHIIGHPNFPARPQPSADNYPIYLDQSLELRFMQFDDGLGTTANPYQITECSQLNQINEYSQSNFVLKNNLNCNQTNVQPITDFSGVFDGNGKNISNLNIQLASQNNVGLFSTLNGVVKKLGLINANITGLTNVGIVAGINNGTIEELKVSGIVSGQGSVGGIVGLNNGEFNANPYNGITHSTAALAKIINSYSEAVVVASNSGLITAINKGHIENVFSTGNLIGNNSAALATTNYTKCYSYQHYFDSAVIKNSIALSSLGTVLTNSCYSHWYQGSVVENKGKITHSITTTDSNYFLDINNSPFNKWNFNSIWNFDGNNITLAWEQ